MYPRTVSPWSITLSHIFWRGRTHAENWMLVCLLGIGVCTAHHFIINRLSLRLERRNPNAAGQLLAEGYRKIPQG